jgi:hypothetical protein
MIVLGGPTIHEALLLRPRETGQSARVVSALIRMLRVDA